MILRVLTALAVVSLGTGYACAQADVVDPQTGNYRPGTDPLDRYDARPSRPSLNRVNRSIAQRLGKPGASAQYSDGATSPTPATTGVAQAIKYPSWWPK